MPRRHIHGEQCAKLLLSMDLAALLQSTFGFASFRPNQQAVCEAAAGGRDVLLVMPTGAGKSLCYQLPALARGGTALVISPLIALMDDQAAKLAAAGLRVARIHSGLSRDQSRQACRDYLTGDLDFLFIAPERMRVPGFPEMLARRKPSLIAIDEAHCISQWGHDFRPDYRTLGDHLPALRPAPIVALTATATPVVQRDIVAQLRLNSPALFIHGFRRSNLAIEVVEMPVPQRAAFARQLLAQEGMRPAIIYAPSRKLAESFALELGRGAAVYHAGLEPALRDRVQRQFLSGDLNAIVATIAFGMGIDKADVRTVLHLALPASVEGYYQEIGRAGRDGLPSRTVLLHSFADRRMHEFFLERDYPAAAELNRVAAALAPEPRSREALAARLKMPLDDLDRALLKLASQGAATLELDGSARRTDVRSWQTGYDAQLSFRRQQIENMVRFAETPQCRMTALIRHFGDTGDSHRPCGHCDVCAPGNTRASTFRTPTAQEQKHLRAILAALGGNSRSTGKLFTDLALTRERKDFDELLNGLARAGLLTLANDNFTSATGESITYRKATLTHEGRHPDPGDLPVNLRQSNAPKSGPRERSRRGSREAGTNPRALGTNPRAIQTTSESTSAPLTPPQQALADVLRAWRASVSKAAGKPAFIVLSDRTLHAIAVRNPSTLTELSHVPGIGPDKLDRYGSAILTVCRDQSQSSGDSPRPAPPPKSVSSRPEATERVAAVERPASPPKSVSSRPQVTQRVTAVERPAAPSASPAANLAFHKQPPASLTAEQQAREQRLITWRSREAERLGLPHFLVLSGSAIRHLASQGPSSALELGVVPGLSAEHIARYATDLLACCAESQPPAAASPSVTASI